MRNKKIIVSFTVVLLLFVLPMMVNSQFKKKRPDLEVTKMWLKGDCQIYITIENNGPGKLLPSAYDMKKGAAIQMYRNSKPWGGIRLGAVDKGKVLVNPGGKITHKWFPLAANLKLPTGGSLMKVVVDNNNVVKETNELNNSLTRKLNCVVMSKINFISRDTCYGMQAATSNCFEITGEKFGNTPGNTLVFMNSSQVAYHTGMWNEFLILAIAPASAINLGVTNKVYFKRNGVLASNKKSFTPWGFVDSVSPASLTKPTFISRIKKRIVTIRTSFIFGPGSYKVYFGSKNIPILSWTQLSWPEAAIKVRIPSDLPLGKYVVRIKKGTVFVTNPASTTPVFEYK